MASAIIASTTDIGNQPAATGQAQQAHMVYCANVGVWVAAAFTSTQTLTLYYSSDGSTWTAFSTTKSLANAHRSEGRGLSLAYANISSTDVIHIAVSYQAPISSYHIRAVVSSGPSIAFSSELQLGASNGAGPAADWDAPITCIDSGAHIYQMTGFTSAANTDFGVSTFPNTDSGSSWTQGTETYDKISSPTGDVNSHAGFGISSSTMMAIADNTSVSNLLSSHGSGASFSASANVLSSNVTGGNANNWGAVALSTSDIHAVYYKSSTAAWTHRRWNGTSWGAGDTIPALTIKSASGVGLVSDGTSVWMFVLANATGNAVQYVKWTSGVGWDAAWSTLESSSQTRTNVSVCPQVANSKIFVLWTEKVTTTTFQVVGEALSLATTSTRTASSAAIALQALGVTRTASSGAIALQALGVPHTTTNAAIALKSVGLTRTANSAAIALLQTYPRTASGAALSLKALGVQRSAPGAISLQALGLTRTATPAQLALQQLGILRTITGAAISLTSSGGTSTFTRTITSGAIALESLGLTRTASSAAIALQQLGISRQASAAISVQQLGNLRTASAAQLALQALGLMRTASGGQVALKSVGLTRAATSAQMALQVLGVPRTALAVISLRQLGIERAASAHLALKALGIQRSMTGAFLAVQALALARTITGGQIALKGTVQRIALVAIAVQTLGALRLVTGAAIALTTGVLSPTILGSSDLGPLPGGSSGLETRPAGSSALILSEPGGTSGLVASPTGASTLRATDPIAIKEDLH